MKLVPKLSLAFIAGVSIILAANGYFRVQREVALFESDRIRDDVVMARTLGAAVATVWQSDGPSRALAMVRQADEQEGRVHLRWVWLDPDAASPHLDREDVASLEPGDSLTSLGKGDTGEERRFTFVRVAVPGGRRGALEVSEPLAIERAYIRRTILDTIATTLTLDAFCAALAMVLGGWIVGRPMRSLMEKARRVGLGDFGTPLYLAQKDELAALAGEMNAMCDRLVEANGRIAAETAARIRMLEQLRHADRLMTVGKLASGIAHELGTPLNVVEARASMIGAGETTAAESSEYARIIVRATEQMTRIIRQLLAFARPSVARKARCDLAVVARHTIELLKPLADKRHVGLEIESSTDEAIAQADAGQIEQAMTNLVMNAIQAMDRAGTVKVAIDRVKAKPPVDHDGDEGEHLRIRVKDEGRGIASDHVAHVFEPFFTTKDVGEGTGLGLSVTYGIVREHGGWIAVESQLGHGAEFSVYLPSTREES
jgi:signal transduction histidine kinase